MNRKIYIASGLKNYLRVLDLRDKLLKYDISLTYDWADVFRVHMEEQIATGKIIEEDLEKIAITEYQGVVDCEAFLMIMPGGRGAHVELGLAYAMKKHIIILYDDGIVGELIAFHKLPGVERCKTEAGAIKRLLEILS